MRLPDTAAGLIVGLRAMVPATIIKAWLMDRESDRWRLEPVAGGGMTGEPGQTCQNAVFLEFLDPATSPVPRAWAEGTNMLKEDGGAGWESLAMFSPATDSMWARQIGAGVVPALAHTLPLAPAPNGQVAPW